MVRCRGLLEGAIGIGSMVTTAVFEEVAVVNERNGSRGSNNEMNHIGIFVEWWRVEEVTCPAYFFVL